MKQARPKALISWSSGKDSAFALHEVQARRRIRCGRRADDGDRDIRPGVDPRRAAGNFAGAARRRGPAAAHRADSLSLPERDLRGAHGAKPSRAPCSEGITHIIFGDLFLADIRAYREQKLAGTGITPVFPLWDRPTLPLAHAMIDKRAQGLSCHRRSEETAGGIRRAQIRCAIARRSARRRRPLRRERRVSHLRGGGADFFATDSGCRPASASSATAMAIAIW